VLVQHPRVSVQVAVHRGFPVALVRQNIVLEAGRAFLLVGNSSRALEIDAAVVDIGKVAIRSWAEVVRLLPTVHQVLLDADAQVPVRPRDVHQLGEGVHPAQVVHLGQVLQLPSRLPIRCRFVD